jgi:hypothetical protein
MRLRTNLFLSIAAAGVLAAGSASANVCRTNSMTCPTNMPEGGYCQCAQGASTEEGTVFLNAAANHKPNGKTAGCGQMPNAPACR